MSLAPEKIHLSLRQVSPWTKTGVFLKAAQGVQVQVFNKIISIDIYILFTCVCLFVQQQLHVCIYGLGPLLPTKSETQALNNLESKL